MIPPPARPAVDAVNRRAPTRARGRPPRVRTTRGRPSRPRWRRPGQRRVRRPRPARTPRRPCRRNADGTAYTDPAGIVAWSEAPSSSSAGNSLRSTVTSVVPSFTTTSPGRAGTLATVGGTTQVVAGSTRTPGRRIVGGPAFRSERRRERTTIQRRSLERRGARGADRRDERRSPPWGTSNDPADTSAGSSVSNDVVNTRTSSSLGCSVSEGRLARAARRGEHPRAGGLGNTHDGTDTASVRDRHDGDTDPTDLSIDLDAHRRFPEHAVIEPERRAPATRKRDAGEVTIAERR